MKKLKLLIIIISIFIFLSLNIVFGKTLPLKNKVITIDAGHGGRDPGATYNDIFEKNINLEISLKLEKELLKQGATVFMIRRSDIDLSSIYDSKKKRGDLYRRLQLIKKNKSDMYISIHINWYKNSNYKGAEVLYNPINSNNKTIAKIIMEEFQTNLNSNRTINTTDLYMYKNTTIPGVLVECGYLSNYEDRNKLLTSNYQQKIASSITKGIIRYFMK